MNSSIFYACCFALVLPYLAIVAILLLNSLRCARWRRSRNLRGPNPPLCSTSAAIGAILLLWQVFYRPSVAHVVEVREQIDADEDDSGDPEHPSNVLLRQLKRIRRGEPVGDLVLRL